MHASDGSVSSRRVEIVLDLPRVTIALSLGVAALVVAGVLAAAFQYLVRDFPGRDTFVILFDLNKEESIPNWYSSVQLLLASGLLSAIALATGRLGLPRRLHWVVLALIFLYLSADEAASIHNYLGNYQSSNPGDNGTGLASIPWVWPAIVLVAIFVIAFIPFLRGLPRRFVVLFVLAGAVYVSGALGLEIVGALFQQALGGQTFAASLMLAIEETTEMIGEVVFIYAFLSYMATYLPGLRIRPGSGANSDPGG